MSSFVGSPSRSTNSWAYRIRDPRPPPDDDAKAWMLTNLRRKRLLSGPTVDIYVGEQRRHWALHRNLLCHHSEYLASELLSARFEKESGKQKSKKDANGATNGIAPGENKLELPDFDPAGFELFVKWLYQGRIDDVATLSSDQQKYEYAVACHQLYVLCDRFDIPYLKNIAIDQYRQGLTEAKLVPDAEEINQIYRRSPANSPFRKLMVRIAARQLMDPEALRDAESYRTCFEDNPDFSIDLFTVIKAESGGILFQDPTEMSDCEYHDHEGGLNCHNKGKARVQESSNQRLTLPSDHPGPTIQSSTLLNNRFPTSNQDAAIDARIVPHNAKISVNDANVCLEHKLNDILQALGGEDPPTTIRHWLQALANTHAGSTHASPYFIGPDHAAGTSAHLHNHDTAPIPIPDHIAHTDVTVRGSHVAPSAASSFDEVVRLDVHAKRRRPPKLGSRKQEMNGYSTERNGTDALVQNRRGPPKLRKAQEPLAAPS